METIHFLMEFFSEEGLIEFFSQYAYQPYFVYLFLLIFMTASSFGFPVPEELVIISVGIVAYISSHPDLYPPPSVDANGLSLFSVTLVAFFSVLLSDILVFLVGRKYGARLLKTSFIKKRFSKSIGRVERFFDKYGNWACYCFRFMPGLRFPGHFTCGAMKIPLWKFIALDGLAAIVLVPTQILLIGYYGGVILAGLKQFRIWTFVVFVVALVIWIGYKIYQLWIKRTPAIGHSPNR